MPSPTSLATSTTGPASAAAPPASASISAADVALRRIRFASQSVRQSTRIGRPGRAPASAAARAERLLERASSAARAARDARRCAPPSRRPTARRWRDSALVAAPRSPPRRSGSCPSARREHQGQCGSGAMYDRAGMTPPPSEDGHAHARRGGLLARGRRPRRLPNGSARGSCASVSPLTVAGAAPASHRTSLSRRAKATLARARMRGKEPSLSPDVPSPKGAHRSYYLRAMAY